jgi:hypothetical protein
VSAEVKGHPTTRRMFVRALTSGDVCMADIEYRDFTIEVQSKGRGRFEAKVVDAPIRAFPCVPFSRPIERKVLNALADSLGGVKKAKTPVPAYREMGRQLYEAVFQPDVAELFRRCQDCLAGKAGLRVRLRFRFSDPEAPYLAALPWELLCEDTPKYMATGRSTPIVREIQNAQPIAPLGVDPPLRILVVDAVASPADAIKQRTEVDRMAAALGELVDNGVVELLQLEEPRPDPLRDILLDEKIHVLHFIGHGGFDRGSGFGALFFAHPSGAKHQVGGVQFATYLDDIPDLRLVVLNSCLSARHSGRAGFPLYMGVAAAILDQTTVPAVVANQYAITHDAAIEFSKTFYSRIAAGDGIESAVTEVRLRLRHRSREWATPVLFLGASDGKLFNVRTVKSRSKVRVVRRVLRTDPVRLGIRSMTGWGGDMAERNDAFLDLVPYFKGRTIRSPKGWNGKVLPQLEDFLLGHIDERRPLLLDFAAHSSIAFSAGWILDAKSGLDVRVRQRTQAGGAVEWYPQEGEVPEGPLWRREPEIELAAKAPDIALAIAVSQPKVAAQVEAYIRRQALPVSRLLRATIAPEPGSQSVASGAHALRLAQTLLPVLRERRPHERGGCVHIFGAAPNALMFYLGQLSRSLGPIVLYEHPFGQPKAWGKYQPSIRLEASSGSGPASETSSR